MNTLFEKYETWFCMLLIALYIIINSFCIQNFGMRNLNTVLINSIFSLTLLILIFSLNRVRYYGLTLATNTKQYFYFIPLLVLSTMNLWNGMKVENTAYEIGMHILNMINVGFIEEILFRGFLFKMMEKEKVKHAILISAFTFGVGHIVNLLNGAEFVSTLLQIVSAIAIGYLFVIIFDKTKSLVPCIASHIFINATSIFVIENEMVSYITTIVVIIVCVVYANSIRKVELR